MQRHLKKNKKKLDLPFNNLRPRYIDDVFSINNFRFDDYGGRIYPIKLEIEDTTDANWST